METYNVIVSSQKLKFPMVIKNQRFRRNSSISSLIPQLIQQGKNENTSGLTHDPLMKALKKNLGYDMI